MNHKQLRGMAVLLPILVLAFSLPLFSQAKPSGNLVKQVLDHKADVTWITYKTPTLPDDVCTLLSVCSGPAAQVAALPPATIGGHKVGRALFLTQLKNQPAIVLEHQVPGREVYFFLLGPDGSLAKTAYLEDGKSFLVIANSLAQATFNPDMKDWSAWADKLGSAKPDKASADKGN
jgi:hypothetical protein